MLRRVLGSASSGVNARIQFPCTLAAQTRALHYPLTAPPVATKYLDTDPLEFALRQECRNFNLDDFEYARELAFVRINDNPTVGQWRNLSSQERAEMFFGSNRQDFYRYFTYKVLGKPEHLYHYRG